MPRRAGPPDAPAGRDPGGRRRFDGCHRRDRAVLRRRAGVAQPEADPVRGAEHRHRRGDGRDRRAGRRSLRGRTRLRRAVRVRARSSRGRDGRWRDAPDRHRPRPTRHRGRDDVTRRRGTGPLPRRWRGRARRHRLSRRVPDRDGARGGWVRGRRGRQRGRGVRDPDAPPRRRLVRARDPLDLRTRAQTCGGSGASSSATGGAGPRPSSAIRERCSRVSSPRPCSSWVC